VTESGDMPTIEFAFPGPLRDLLVAAILDGSKTSTSSTVEEYVVDGSPIPSAGDLGIVIDSDGRAAAVIETTDVRVCRIADVDLAHALDEGEGYTTVAEWRESHEEFWRSVEVRAELGDDVFPINDDTLVYLVRFRLLERT
jgi:uncharacterized protein YhfF